MHEFDWKNFQLFDEIDIPENQYLYLEGKYEIYTHESWLPTKQHFKSYIKGENLKIKLDTDVHKYISIFNLESKERNNHLFVS